MPIVPSACYKCASPAEGTRICGKCAPLSPFTAVYAATPYRTAAKEVVRRLKYGRAQAAVHSMARLMYNRLPHFPSSIVVTSAPTATTRARVRGYDQSELLARALAKSLALSYRSMLIRTGQTRQVGATREQRQKQMQDAFSAKIKTSSSITRVILIDDVLTTGATLEAAATPLAKAGVKEIIVVVFAVA